LGVGVDGNKSVKDPCHDKYNSYDFRNGTKKDISMVFAELNALFGKIVYV